MNLRQIQSAVSVAVAALRRQSCEIDLDVANLLQRSVGDRIEDQIEGLERLDGPASRSSAHRRQRRR